MANDYISLKNIPTENLNLSDDYISIKTNEKLLNVSKKSICLIETEHKTNNKNEKEIGTGFLIKLSFPSIKKPFYGIITNNHVLDSDFIKNNKKFKIYFPEDDSESIEDRSSYIIKCDEDCFVFTSELIDVTFIQLHEGYVNNPEFEFFNPYNGVFDEEDPIYIFQYPNGKLSFADGFIVKSSSFNYFHNASTDEGSSGSPILNKNMEVIGIHKANQETQNEGNFNMATKISVVLEVLHRIYYKGYINDIKKARDNPRILSDDEEKEIRRHGLKKIKEIPNMYQCPYLSSSSSLVMLFFRTNHGWYFTSKIKNRMSDSLDKYNWIFINPYKTFEEIINEFYKEVTIDEFEKKIEHRHELIISWLKVSELMYNI